MLINTTLFNWLSIKFILTFVFNKYITNHCLCVKLIQDDGLIHSQFKGMQTYKLNNNKMNIIMESNMKNQ